MTDRFGAAAQGLAGQAALLLGWSPDRFWAATPEELATVLAAALPPGSTPVTRADFAPLLEQDPDE